MYLRYFILKALCLSICLALSSEESARDYLEHLLLRVPNSDQMLNSVLGRLERNRQRTLSRERLSDEIYFVEPTEILPEFMESIQDTRERALRQSAKPKYYPICLLERSVKHLNTEEYEYRPAHYDEVRCTKTSKNGDSSEVCSSLGFSCVQLNKTINLTRRLYSSDCWESVKLTIPTGCECLWPAHKLGEIKTRSK